MESSLVEFTQEQLNKYRDLMVEQGYPYYDVKVALVKNFDEQNPQDINAVFTFGSAKKVEGSPKTRTMNFNIQVWGELNTNGDYVKEMLNNFFEDYSKTSITLNEHTTYLDFGSPFVIEQHETSEGGERVKFAIQGSIIYSQSISIGRKTYISIGGKEYEIEPISPKEQFTQNRELKSTINGVQTIDTAQGIDGSFSLIYDDSEISDILISISHNVSVSNYGITNNPVFSMKIEYPFKSITMNKLKFSSISSALDEVTKNTIIAVSYVHFDVEG